MTSSQAAQTNNEEVEGKKKSKPGWLAEIVGYNGRRRKSMKDWVKRSPRASLQARSTINPVEIRKGAGD